MKKVLKKIYDVLPNGIKKLYWQTRKKVGQILMFRIVFPLGYKHYIKGKKIKRKKAVFVEVRFDEITDSFRLVYDRMKADGFDIHEQFIENIKPGKWGYIKRCLRMLEDISDAHYVFLNDACNVTSCIPLRKGTKIYQLWHACGAFKKFGQRGTNMSIAADHAYHVQYNMVTVSSDRIRSIYADAFDIDVHKVKALGCPRTDAFYDEKLMDETKQKVYAAHPEFKDRYVIVYAPTFRDIGDDRTQFKPDLDFDKLSKDLLPNQIFVICPHPVMKNKIVEKSYDNIEVIRDFSTNDMMLVSDLLVTDYSSVIFEYALLRKPIAFYCYDLLNYNRGFYLNYPDDLPGDVYETQQALTAYLKSPEKDTLTEKYDQFIEKYMGACDGHSSERIAAMINQYMEEAKHE